MRQAHETQDFYPEVQIHKESYVLIEELTKSQVSLNPFLTQVVTKTNLQLLTIAKCTIQTSLGSPHKVVAHRQALAI
jgi:hypothetical protein